MAKSNNSDVFKIQRIIMKFFGTWPEEHPTRLYKIWGIFTFIWSASFGITMWMEVINDLSDMFKLSEILCSMVSVTAYFVKLSCIIYHKKTFISMIHYIDDPIFLSYPEELDHHVEGVIKISTLLGRIYHSMCLAGIVLYIFFPILDDKPLPFPFPYDVSDYRYVMFVFQIVGVGICIVVNSCLDMLNVGLMRIATAQFNILTDKITLTLGKHLNKNDEYTKPFKKETELKMKQCVEHHLATIKYIKIIEDVFSIGYFGQFIGSTFVICNTLFQFILISLSSMQFFSLTNYFLILAFQLFMYCWFGNEVMQRVRAKESLSIGDACYASEWTGHGTNIRKNLLLIMERSRRPVQIKVAIISKLSLEAFATIIQWSYSYFTLLLNLYYKQPGDL